MANPDGSAITAPIEAEAIDVAPPPPLRDLAAADRRLGVLYGVGAFAFWGAIPLYFKVVSQVAPLEVLAHRVVWSVGFLLPVVWLSRRWGQVGTALRSPRVVLTLLLTTVLIATNWGIFIYSVTNAHVIQASLGYFINPLINVLLGFVFLGERLRRWQGISVLLASAGVAAFIVANNAVPTIALALAFSFGFYGLLRKRLHVEGVTGLLIEAAILAPLALAYLIYLGAIGQRAFGFANWQLDVTLALAGVVTAVPLIWFVNAARRLRLATLGFLHYLTPTGHFICAIAFGEAFTWGHAVTFAFIWIALAIYTVDSLRATKSARA